MLIVANWKAYVEELARAKKLLAVSKRLAREDGIAIVLAPPAPLLGVLSAKNKSRVAFAAQDISATAGDTDAVVAVKLAHALAHGLTPILCVGEAERDGEGRYLALVREEITAAVELLTPRERTRVIVAYEPLWAIGTTAEHAIDPNDLAEMVLYIRKVIAELLPGKSARRSLVLYGGSVEPDNVRGLAGASDVDGFLIGHASVDPHTFAELVKQLT